jgi:hypothetical protein
MLTKKKQYRLEISIVFFEIEIDIFSFLQFVSIVFFSLLQPRKIELRPVQMMKGRISLHGPTRLEKITLRSGLYRLN